MTSKVQFVSALEDFHKARRQAAIQSVVRRIARQPNQLLPYDPVRKQLGGIESAERVLRDIPLAAIVGSVSRYTDFNRDFLPRKKVQSQRWARVKAAMGSLRGLPPIEVYQIGDVYFVQDGNHRVSTARQAGNQQIQAYVKTVRTRVPLTTDAQLDDIIIKAEFVTFLNQTELDETRQQTDLSTTAPGRYPQLAQQIEAIRTQMAQAQKTESSLKEAAAHWHDRVYLPVIEIIRAQNLLTEFPNRTETDLFIWIMKYQADLRAELGWAVSPERTVAAIKLRFSARAKRWQNQIRARFQNWLYGPPTGKWRADQLAAGQGRMFADILAVFNETAESIEALKFAVYAAQMEGAQVFGLCSLPPNSPDQAKKMEALQHNFQQICAAASVAGNLAFSFDKNPAAQILRRAEYASLVVLPFGNRVFQSKTIRTVLQHSPNPVIGIPNPVATLGQKALLAYDGSPNAEEALYLAAYLAKFWEMRLVVLTVFGNKIIPAETLANAYNFLERYQIPTEYIKASGPPDAAVLTFTIEEDCDLVVAGGYGAGWLRRFTGSLVDTLAEKSRQPVLICR